MAKEAVVLFEYEKQQEDELDLKVGEVIQNVIQVDDGWCEGTLRGVRGMFPDNFVEVRSVMKAPPQKIPPVSVPPPVDPIQLRKAHPPEVEASGNWVVVERAPDSNKNKVRRAKVTYSYVAENPDELNLQPGQVVEVIAEEEEGWWRGRAGGKEGLFPSNFVEIIPNDNKPHPSPQHQHPSPAIPPVTNSSIDIPDKPEKPPPPTDHNMRQSAVFGPKLFPTIDPAAARSKLRQTTKPPPPPPSKPEEPPRKPPPPVQLKASLSVSHPAKPGGEGGGVERAKVTFDYTAEQPDELSINVGDMVEVVRKDVQEGWWEVRLGNHVGLVPDNFVEVLPPSTPRKPPPPEPAKEPPPPMIPTKPTPTHKTTPPEPRRPPPPSSSHTTPSPIPEQEEKPSDFGVQPTPVLDNSAVKSRAKKPVSRPPSRSNLHQHLEEPSSRPPEDTSEQPKLSPWQEELQKRKSKAPVAHPPRPMVARKPAPPPAKAKPPPEADKPKPPPAVTKPSLPPVPSPSPPIPSPPIKAPEPAKTEAKTETKPPPPPPPSTATPDATGWKEAFEKLKEEFESFKEDITRDIRTLTDDLDKERKQRAMLEIDIDRLKRAREHR